MKATAFLFILIWALVKSQFIEVDYDLDSDYGEAEILPRSRYVEPTLNYDLADLDILFSGFGKSLLHPNFDEEIVAEEEYSRILPMLLNQANFYNLFKQSLTEIEQLLIDNDIVKEEDIRDLAPFPSACDEIFGK